MTAERKLNPHFRLPVLPVETATSPPAVADINQKLTLLESVVAEMVNRGSDGDHKNHDYRRDMPLAGATGEHEPEAIRRLVLQLIPASPA